MSLRRQVIEGFGWSFVINQILFVLLFFRGIVLARILMPDDFGKFAYMTSIIALIFMVRGLGFDTYVIQCDKNKLNEYGGTAVSLNTALSIVVFFIALGIAALILERDSFPMFTILLIFQTIQHLFFVYPSLIEKELLYKKMAFLSFISNILSTAIGILLAMVGFGIWSLIWMSVVSWVTLIILNIIYSPYSIKPSFSMKAAKDVLNFGKYSILAALTGTSSSKVDNIIVARLSGSEALGFYNRAYGLSKVFNNFVGGVAAKIAAPLFSRFKHERSNLSTVYNDFSAIMFRVNLFFYLIIGCVASDFIELVYTAKWLPSVPVIRVLIIFAVVNPMLGITRRTFLNTGRSKPVGIAQTVLVAVLLITIVPLIKLFGIIGAAIAVDLAVVICFFFLAYWITTIVDANFKKIFFKPLLAAGITIIIYVMLNQHFLPERTWLRLFSYSLFVGFLYLGGIFVMEKRYVFETVKKIKQSYS